MTSSKSKKEVYGMLATIAVELPYKTAEEKREADKLNAGISGLGVRVFRAANDWGYRKYEEAAVNRKKTARREESLPVKFRSGDLVRVFKTVTDGDVCWQGTIDLDTKAYHHGEQKGISRSDWARMFFDGLPVRLEKEGKIIYGGLEPFCETGTEGIIWAVHEYGMPGYGGLHFLKNGDRLTVYSAVRDGVVEWQGRLDFGPEQAAKIDWTEISRQTKHVPTAKWLEWSWQNRPVAVIAVP